MWEWVARLIASLAGPPLPRSVLPRMPVTDEEARRIVNRWDRLNGRYYYVADVRFADGSVARDVVFDADTNIAVSVQPQLFARPIAAALVTRDFSPGDRRDSVTDEERDAFQRGESAGNFGRHA